MWAHTAYLNFCKAIGNRGGMCYNKFWEWMICRGRAATGEGWICAA